MSTKIEDEDLIKAKELFVQSIDYQNSGHLLKAIECLEEAFSLVPSRDSIINNLIILYFTLKQNEKLKTFLTQVTSSQNKQLHNLGQIYLNYLEEDFHKCIEDSNKLLSSENQSLTLQLYDILIKSYFKTHDISNVFLYSRKLLKDKSLYNQRLFSVGNILLCLSKPRAAKWFIQKSLNITFNQAYAFDLGFCYLQLKDFKNGFKYWNNRLEGHDAQNKLFTKIPPLEKIENIENKKILIWSEQGIGDTLNFARYIRLIKKYRPEITFVVQKKLYEIFKKYYDDIKIFSYEDVIDNSYDYQTSLLNLIGILNSNYDEIPTDEFEFTHNKKIEQPIKRVGFAHSGNPSYFRDSYRSIKPDEFESIFSVKSINFFKINSHYEPYVDRHENVEDVGHLSIQEIADKIKDFDLIITTDTFLVHLCGFFNVNCILLLNYNSDWRWFDDYKYTKWYSSVRIIKQKNISDWKNEINIIKRFLRYKSKKNLN